MNKKIGDLTLRELVKHNNFKLVNAFCKKFSIDGNNCSCCPMLSNNDSCIFDDLYGREDMMEVELELIK